MANTTNLSSGSSTASAAPRTASGLTQSMFSNGLTQPTAFRENRVARLQFPSDAPKYYFGIGINDYDRKDLFSFNVGLQTNIVLPLPKQLIDTDHVEYEQKELNVGGAAALGILESIAEADINTAVASVVGAGLSGLGSVAAGVMKDVLNIDAGSAARAFTGAALNPFTTVLLKGPTYKKHEFNWTLAPRNAKESSEIRNIIYKLKASMYVGGAYTGFFTPPKIFTLRYFNNEFYLYKFKPCVLETMSVNYAPSSVPALYKDTGAPDAVELKLSFQEVEFWFKEQIDDPSDTGTTGSLGTERF